MSVEHSPARRRRTEAAHERRHRAMPQAGEVTVRRKDTGELLRTEQPFQLVTGRQAVDRPRPFHPGRRTADRGGR